MIPGAFASIYQIQSIQLIQDHQLEHLDYLLRDLEGYDLLEHTEVSQC